MADIKNFGLTGVGSDIQLGKSGPRLKTLAGGVKVAGSDGDSYAHLFSGTHTITDGGNSADISIADNGVLQFNGTKAFIAPVGGTGQRPGTGLTGMIRVNDDAPAAAVVEFFNGTDWFTLATGGDTTALQTEVDNIESALGGAIDSDGNFVPSGFTGSAAGATSFTEAIQQVADAAITTFDTLFPSLVDGNIIYAAGGVWVQGLPGATTGVQAYDADLSAVAGLATTGYIVRTGDGTATTRAIAGTAGNIVVTNGDGVASDTSLNLATVSQANTGNFVKVTLDSFGRVTGNTPVVTADITALVDATYVNVTGDTMSGNLTMSSGATVTGLPDPVSASDAANKAYVDAVAAGLSWKQAAAAATTGNITLSGTQTVDGVALIVGDRVLVKDQTLPEENGIYVVAAGAWTRSTDADTAPELNSATLFILNGTVNDNTGWTQTATIVTVGTTPQTWVQFSGSATYIAGDGLDLTGNTFSVNVGAGITILPGDEVGIDLYNPSTGALILTSDGTTRDTASGDKLFLLLDSAGGLAQTIDGLKINAASVSNAMLTSSTIGLNADSGTNTTVALGQTLEIAGDSVQGISTSVLAQTITVTASNASSSQKGVATFNTGSFTVTTGDVSLVDVGTPVSASFVKITTDAKGRVTATTPVVTADITALVDATYVNVIGDTMSGELDMGNNKITNLATPTVSDDAATKQYVDDAVGSPSGSVKAYQAVVSLTSLAATNIGSALPAGATVLRVKVMVTTASDAVTTLAVGVSGTPARYADVASNDPQTLGLYLIETLDTDAGSVQVIATVGGTAGTVGSATVLIEYQVA